MWIRQQFACISDAHDPFSFTCTCSFSLFLCNLIHSLLLSHSLKSKIWKKQKVNERELETSCKDNLLTVWLIEVNKIFFWTDEDVQPKVHLKEAKRCMLMGQHTPHTALLTRYTPYRFAHSIPLLCNRGAETMHHVTQLDTPHTAFLQLFCTTWYTLRFFPVHLLSNSHVTSLMLQMNEMTKKIGHRYRRETESASL